MSADPPARPMKFPYTISAKIAQFPVRHYLEHQWLARYWMYGIVLSIPIFYKIHKAANCPENVAKWADIKKREASEHH